ncbi:MAG: hypothetical protein ABIH63_03290 [archaeon]
MSYGNFLKIDKLSEEDVGGIEDLVHSFLNEDWDTKKMEEKLQLILIYEKINRSLPHKQLRDYIAEKLLEEKNNHEMYRLRFLLNAKKLEAEYALPKS